MTSNSRTFLALILGICFWVLISGAISYCILASSPTLIESKYGTPAVAACSLLLVTYLNWIVTEHVRRRALLNSARAFAEANKYQIVEIPCYQCKQLNDVALNLVDTETFVCTNCSEENKIISAFQGIKPSDNNTEIDITKHIIQGEIDV